MTECVQVLTTAGSEQEAELIAAALLERRLAACVQIVGPVLSRYRWRGEIEREREWQCLAKTTRARFETLAATIREVHSYEEPEIVATPVVAGSPGYLAWVEDNVAS